MCFAIHRLLPAAGLCAHHWRAFTFATPFAVGDLLHSVRLSNILAVCLGLILVARYAKNLAVFEIVTPFEEVWIDVIGVPHFSRRDLLPAQRAEPFGDEKRLGSCLLAEVLSHLTSPRSSR